MRWLETLDRRWLFLIVGVLVMVPLIRPLSLPLFVSAPVQGFVDAIDRVPDGATVLMSCDYDPGSRPELVPMTRTALQHLWSRHCKVVVPVLWPGGSGIVDQVLREEARKAGKVYGVDYIDLGYKSGNEAVMVLMGQSIPSTFPHDNS